MMKKLFLLAFAAFAFSACSDEYNYYEIPDTHTVDFEAARLGEEGYIWGKPQAVVLTGDDPEANYFGDGSKYFFAPIYTEGGAAFYSLYTDYLGLYGSATDVWNGFVISNCTDMEKADFSNDKSVYAKSGASGSKQFAVGYYGAWTGDPFGTPAIRFSSAVTPISVAVANTTFLYLYFKGPGVTVVDVKLVIEGFNSGVKTGEVEVKLADKATGMVKSGWENVDLKSLGLVTSMNYKIVTTDVMAPMYFAIDNLVYHK